MAVLAELTGPDAPEREDKAADALGLLALVAGQDVEPAEGSDGADGRWRIARRVAPDRVISTVDPETRHTRKSKSNRRDGFRGHVAAEPETGLITDGALTKAAGRRAATRGWGRRSSPATATTRPTQLPRWARMITLSPIALAAEPVTEAAAAGEDPGCGVGAVVDAAATATAATTTTAIRHHHHRS